MLNNVTPSHSAYPDHHQSLVTVHISQILSFKEGFLIEHGDVVSLSPLLQSVQFLCRRSQDIYVAAVARTCRKD